ncbi:MAG TPA: glycosyltransferase family 39 protein [Blastocatellia bacterium]|nr:glycosyltransferase family 39 protein [Blastocatellia bacterium]
MNPKKAGGRIVDDLLARRRRTFCFCAVFAAAFLLRVVLIIKFGSHPVNDQIWDDAVGWNLATGHGFTASQSDPRVPGVFRTPVYPGFLSVIYFLFGHSYEAVYIAQSVLDSLSAVLIGLIACSLISERVGIMTGALYALYPYSAIFCGAVGQDILLTFSVLVVLSAVVIAMRRAENLWAWFIVGVATGCTALVKANFILFITVPFLTALLMTRRIRRPTPVFAVMAAGLVLVVAPWVLRNYIVFGSFPPLAAGGTGTNLMYLLDELEGGEEMLIGRYQESPKDGTAGLPYLEKNVDGAALIVREKELAGQAVSELARRWPEYLVLILKHIPRLWVTRHALGQSRLVGLAGQFVPWIFFVPGVAGMVLLFRRRRELIPLYATVSVITLMYAPYTAEARYTLPARPALILFAGFTFTYLLEKFISYRHQYAFDRP